MNQFYRLFIALAICCMAVFGFGQMAEFVPGEVLVKFKSTKSPGAVENKAIKATVLRSIPQLGVQVIKLPAGMSTQSGLDYYRNLSTVEYAELDSKKKLFAFTPNDTQWAAQYAQKKVKCPEAWDLTKGSSNVVVAVLDTGADLGHEDMQGKFVTGFDFSDNDPDVTPAGDHGVHTCGIVGANTNNAKGVAGTAFNCKVMPLKIFPNSFDSVSAAAIIYAADHGAKVISMSYGGPFESQTEKSAINYAWSKGVVLVAAAGNDGTSNKGYPAAFPNCIAVGSTGVNDIHSDFSTWGPDWVDVGAPGENVLSTVIGGYANNTGTSMSCPVVAGVAALCWSIAPNGTTNVAIRNAIESTTDPIPGNFYKFGRVNAFQACKLFDAGSLVLSTPTAVDVWMGDGISGDLTDITTSDSNYFEVGTVPDALGQIAGVKVTVALNGDSSGLRSAQLILDANGASGATNQVFFKNVNTGNYDLIKATALMPTGINRQKIILPTNLTKYVSGGNIEIGLRAIGPKKALKGATPLFIFKVNFVQIETRPGN